MQFNKIVDLIRLILLLGFDNAGHYLQLPSGHLSAGSLDGKTG